MFAVRTEDSFVDVVVVVVVVGEGVTETPRVKDADSLLLSGDGTVSRMETLSSEDVLDRL
jgi:hypothetical protein